MKSFSLKIILTLITIYLIIATPVMAGEEEPLTPAKPVKTKTIIQNERTCIAILKQLNTANEIFKQKIAKDMDADNDGEYASDFQELTGDNSSGRLQSDAVGKSMINMEADKNNPCLSQRNGYWYRILTSKDTKTGQNDDDDECQYACIAWPVTYGETGMDVFAMTEDGSICWYENNIAYSNNNKAIPGVKDLYKVPFDNSTIGKGVSAFSYDYRKYEQVNRKQGLIKIADLKTPEDMQKFILPLLKTIHYSQAVFKENVCKDVDMDNDGEYATDFQELKQKHTEEMLEAFSVNPPSDIGPIDDKVIIEVAGYYLKIFTSADTGQQNDDDDEVQYACLCWPVKIDKVRMTVFGLTEDGMIYNFENKNSTFEGLKKRPTLRDFFVTPFDNTTIGFGNHEFTFVK